MVYQQLMVYKELYVGHQKGQIKLTQFSIPLYLHIFVFNFSIVSLQIYFLQI
ncbi:unnamed protein product [Paramecium pentaurelia]|uniref:Transmembrane protein n=1 Tax=Paramecium pentaurelia TaxID=43138 RepID=A0A8S1UX85_9CILI|nr:unnamed protein product [Paramecium pentaurelia]